MAAASEDRKLYPIPIFYTGEQESSEDESYVETRNTSGGRGGHNSKGRYVRNNRGPGEIGRGTDNRSRDLVRGHKVGRGTERNRNSAEQSFGSDSDEDGDKSRVPDSRTRYRGRGNRYRGRGRGFGRGDAKANSFGEGKEDHELVDTPLENRYGRERRKGFGGEFRGSADASNRHDSRANTPSTSNKPFDRYEGAGRGRGKSRGRLRQTRSESALNRLDLSGSQNSGGYKEKHRSKENKPNVAKERNVAEAGDVNKRNENGTSSKGKQIQREFKLGYKKLEEWSKRKDDPDDLVLTIGNTRSGLIECLEKTLKPDWIHRILEVLCIAVKTQTCIHTLRELLHTIEETLLQNINDLLSQILIESETHGRYLKSKEELKNVCLLVITVLKFQMNILPTSLSKCYPVILLLKQVFSERNLEDQLLSNEMQELEMLKDSIKEEREKIRKHMTKASKHQQSNEAEEEPPEDFRNLSILPSATDLLTYTKPFLRPNVEEGKYKDLNHYLDIQFRLLREDYIRPLREGIRDYKTAITLAQATKKVREIRLYHNVQVLMPVCTLSGICYVLQFDIEPFKKINWTASKRLLYGSLVCLSADEFDTLIFGTVTDRDAKQLSNGQIQVLFESENETEIKPNIIYKMAETTAYFEAYRYVLEGLYAMKDSMPFQRYIIQCESTVKPPKYLLDQAVPVYDFKCVLHKTKSKTKVTEFPVLNAKRWPGEEDLAFDSSQLDAMKMALTKELALIQGIVNLPEKENNAYFSS